MDIETLIKTIENHRSGHADFVSRALTAERYYRNHSEILDAPAHDDRTDEEGNPLRNADNRIPNDFYSLLVNQEASYMFTDPPLFDVGNKSQNTAVTGGLGDDYTKYCCDLCVNASNDSVAWAHYWTGEDGSFQWAPVDPKQVIPLYDKSLKRKLIGVLRTYKTTDDDGNDWEMYEFWDDTYVQSYRKYLGQYDDADNLSRYEEYFMFQDPVTLEDVNYYAHGFGDVPFIEFDNNSIGTGDLDKVKPLIDVYDKVYSGFINDLDDIQAVIFVLSGYGGEDLNGFLQQLKKYKTIKINDDGDAGSAGVSTLSIEIPVEARSAVLEATRKAIFDLGQGYDPRPENFGNSSGEALKFMYSTLEMKCAFKEMNFRPGFAKLVKAICRHAGFEPKKIIQTWTRNRIRNDSELVQMCQQSVGVISKRTILANHPFVTDVEAELKQIDKEEQEAQQKADIYGLQAFGHQPVATNSGDESDGADTDE